MPDNLLSTVDGMMDGISKVFQGKTIRPPGFYEHMRVGASLHVDVSISTVFNKICQGKKVHQYVIVKVYLGISITLGMLEWSSCVK